MSDFRSVTPTWLAGVAASLLVLAQSVSADEPRRLAETIAQIDSDTVGSIGVHVRHLGQGWVVNHNAERDWYLASTIKIPLAVVLMQRAEAGDLSLDDELKLAESDFVDGAGELLWTEPGTRFSLAELNVRSVRDSDSTATDMLIRHLGQEAFNRDLRRLPGGEGFGPITTIVQVRKDAWSEVHPRASGLSNLDFIELSSERNASRRHGIVLDKLGIPADQADAESTEEAFERYYRSGRNAGNLVDFAHLLEALVRGELLDADNTRALIEIMESVNTGVRRIKAGLPASLTFAHKTGTQVGRSCNIGVINARQTDEAVIVAMCAERYQQLAQAEAAFQAVGRAVAGTVRPGGTGNLDRH